MSLVNDMLRDLDQRRQQPQDATGMAMTPAPGLAQGASQTRWVPLALLTLVVVTALAGLWLYDNQPLWQNQPVAAVTDQTPLAEPVTKPVAKPAIKPQPAVAQVSPAVKQQAISLQQLNWVQHDRQLQLQIGLNRAPSQRIEMSTDRTLTLEFGAVGLGAFQLPAPPVELIRTAQLENSDGELTLKLAASQPVLFDVVASQPGGNYQLSIMIEPQLTAVAETKTAPLPPSTSKPVTSAEALPKKPPVRVAAATTVSAKAVSTKPAASAALPKRPLAVLPKEPRAVLPEKPSAPLRKMIQQTPLQLDHAMVAKASDLINQRQLSQAQQQLADFIDRAPAAMESRTLLATLQIGTEQLEQAEQLVDTGLEIDPVHAGLRKLKARLLLQAGQTRAAIELLTPSMPAVSDDIEFHQIRAAALQAAGQHQQAAEAYHGLLNVRSTEPAWWIGLGLSLEALQQPQQARQAYQNVLKIPQLSSALSDYVEQRLARLGG